MARYQILLADDSRMVRNVIKGYLQGLDCKFTEASDGIMAYELANKVHFDLIITDVEMPGKNGFELCQDLKKHPATRGIPILIISSFDAEQDIHTGFQAGATAYLSKDEVQDQLVPKVESILSKSFFNVSKQILIVDDSALIRRLLKNELSKEGYQIATAENGEDALVKIRAAKPDLILSDIDMPVMNGFRFCEAVHNDPALKTIPFIVMSTNSDRGHMQRMLQQGAQAYLVKPFNTDQLIILIDKLLSHQFVMLLKERERLDSERHMMLASITSLVNALEARDPYTRGHSTAVARIASGMAGLTGATPDECQTVLIGGQLHDIGKIGIRDDVLLKPDRLTQAEYELIKQHPVIGTDILAPIESLRDIIPMVRFHHERFDGKGYPTGLGGQDIPLWARITSVADTFHALTSNRTYRRGVRHDNALKVIREITGRQLCPDCVALFLDWIHSDEATAHDLDDPAGLPCHIPPARECEG